jgi:hypothetical protein
MLRSLGDIIDTAVLEAYETIKVLPETRAHQHCTSYTTCDVWSSIMKHDKDSLVEGLVGPARIDRTFWFCEY